MSSTKSTKRKATVDSHGHELYLAVSEERSNGYFHLRARVATQKYQQGGTYAGSWQADGVDDDYSDGLLWSGLRASCQGDEDSRRRDVARGAVYGFEKAEYAQPYSVDLRKARRMLKTLETIERGLAKLYAVRGSVKSFGEQVGRLAEVLGCAGIAIERGKEHQVRSGTAWDWLSIGDGVDRVDHAIYRWQREAIEAQQARAPRQLEAAEAEIVEG